MTDVRHPLNGPAFSFAFQPILDIARQEIFSYEALIRGVGNTPASQVLTGVPAIGLYAFDQQARLVAIELAASLGITTHLNLNYLPLSLRVLPSSIPDTLCAAGRAGIPIHRVVLEVTEAEVIEDQASFARILNIYRGFGMKVAIDDFGAGYSGLNLLANFQPDQIKLDMTLVRGIERHGPRQAIVRALMQISLDLGIDVVAEGVETADEFEWLAEEGVHLFQGYLFAAPGFECLPAPHFPHRLIPEAESGIARLA